MYDDILHLTFIRANRWMHAVELQAKRIIGPVTDLSVGHESYRTEWNQRHLDLDYFLIALNRLRVAVRSANETLRNARITTALKVFDTKVPDVKDLRDIAEHFDKYDREVGKLNKKKTVTSESPSYSWGESDGGINYRGKQISVVTAREAARQLHKVVLDTLRKAGKQIDLSEWPLIQ
jgi:hypothetical protein